MVQGGVQYAIVDGVDWIVVDEAQTRLIISGRAGDSSELYRADDESIPGLVEDRLGDDLVGSAVELR